MADQDTAQEVASYKYYILGDTIPVRISFNKNGLPFNAEVPDPETTALVSRATYLGKVEQSREVKEVDRATFEKRLTSGDSNLQLGK